MVKRRLRLMPHQRIGYYSPWLAAGDYVRSVRAAGGRVGVVFVTTIGPNWSGSGWIGQGLGAALAVNDYDDGTNLLVAQRTGANGAWLA